MISHRLLSGVLSKSSPTAPVGVEVVVGVDVDFVVVEEALVEVEEALVVLVEAGVVLAVPGRHCE